MSKLNELIQELSPNGVEYKMLGEIGRISMCKRIMKSETNANGDVPFFKIGTFGRTADSYISQTTFEKYKENYPYPQKGDILISAAGTVGRTEIFDGKPAYFQDSNIVWVDNDEAIVLNKFLYYYYQLQPWQVSTGGTIARLYNDNIRKTKIPVPPLQVQHEIVRILDTFAELAKELAKELANRKKQYEYYRNELFKFNNKITYVALGDICDVTAGGTPSKQRKEYWDNGIIKWLGSTVCKNQKSIDEITDYITKKGFEESSAKMMKKNTTLIALVGATIGKVAFLPFEAAINQNIAGVYPKDTKVLDPDYLYYACAGLHSKFTALTQNSKLTIANLSFVRSLQIPVPALKVQKRIVNILDRFDILCNDLANGLPAEIEARQKQYEYYRDKLLTFKELSK